MDEMKNIVKNIIKTAQECKNNGNYDTAFNCRLYEYEI